MTRRCLPLVLSLALLAAAPATAAAAYFGEVEPLTLRGDESCVVPTGLPGEIAVPGKTGVQLVQAAREGLRRGATVDLGSSFYDCASVVSRPNGAAVIAGRSGTASGVVIAVREPGGAWGAPVTIKSEGRWVPAEIRAAVSDRGDVLVTWREDESRSERSSLYRFRAVRRLPGAAFGSVEAVGAADARNDTILPAVAGTGEAFVLTTRTDGTKPPLRSPVNVSSAAPGAPFGAPVLVATMPWLAVPALVAGADGRALAIVPDGTSVVVAERTPGGAFGPSAPVGPAAGSWLLTSASVGAAGEAVVGWVSAIDGSAGLVRRGAAGPFGPAHTLTSGALVPDNFDPFLVSQTLLTSVLGQGGLTRGNTTIGTTALTPDGRALFAWFEGETAPAAPTLVTAPLAGGPVSSQAGGRGLVPPAAFPVVLGDGTPGLAWVEAAGDSFVTSSTSATYTLRFATERTAVRPNPAAPRVTVGAPRSAVLRGRGTLRLPVRCGGPCEVRGEITAGAGDVSGVLRLSRAGRGTLTIRNAAIGLAAPRGRVTIKLAYRSPGGTEAKARTIRVTLAQPAGAPDSRVRDLRAVRSGDRIRVTWRTAGDPGDDSPFFVSAATTNLRDEEPSTLRLVSSTPRKRDYAVTLRADADVRFVAVRSSESLVSGRPATVRVR